MHLFQIIYVTGGQELTIISTAASATMENVRIEVVSYTKLILEVPDFTVTGIFQSVRFILVVLATNASMPSDMLPRVGHQILASWP